MFQAPPNHRLLLHADLGLFNFNVIVNLLTEIVLISRSFFRYCGARGKFLTLKNVVIFLMKLFYTQIDSVLQRISTSSPSDLCEPRAKLRIP